MRVFVLTCLLSLALAAPQGYNYQQQQQQQQLQPGSLQLPAIPQIASIDGQQLLQQALQAPKVQQVLSSAGGSSLSYNSQQQLPFGLQQQSSNFGYNTGAQQEQQQAPPSYNGGGGPSLVSKDIYVHVPPPDQEEEQRYAQPQYPIPPPRKHYRIVFIKAPTPSVSKASLRIKQAPTEEKTIIYVLTKKPDPVDLQAAFEQAAPKPPSKPEVFFIKYKTQEEAAHAQRTIQAQYDQLGGTTQISDEGIAPVTSVIGVLDNQRASGSLNAASNGAAFGVGGGQVSNQYLPANLRA
ncbi:uncharacterized protein LOC115621036 [Scaptodrosophila lebanonensis]|uniref:Uncharacterized protein LOC115621036 n=1 Tax=Drosophila lebanonensis TaxID=7225 RepID=A0A6J2T5L8_DROLE|nr:uncharacterized protein LOC115621036 [Scaptodrosophila lebanonensis]